jgi:hypothetical protein
MVNTFVSARCARKTISTREFSSLVKHRRCDFLLFRPRLFWEKRHAQHFVQLDRLSARAGSRWPPRARESRQAVDRARPGFNRYQHGDPALRGYNHAQDTCVREALLAVSVDS